MTWSPRSTRSSPARSSSRSRSRTTCATARPPWRAGAAWSAGTPTSCSGCRRARRSTPTRGLRWHPLKRGKERPLELPGRAALAFGDRIVGVEGGLRYWSMNPVTARRGGPSSTARPRRNWRHLLEIDFDRALVTHGEPVLRDGPRRSRMHWPPSPGTTARRGGAPNGTPSVAQVRAARARRACQRALLRDVVAVVDEVHVDVVSSLETTRCARPSRGPRTP